MYMYNYVQGESKLVLHKLYCIDIQNREKCLILKIF